MRDLETILGICILDLKGSRIISNYNLNGKYNT